jgi:hypothetical protein
MSPLRPTLLAALLAVPLAASADELPNHRLLSDQFRVSLGGFHAESISQARLGSSTGGAGVDVSFEDALGLESRKLVGELTMYWRFAENWRLDLNYFNLKRSADRTLTADIAWGDNTYTAGTVVSSTLEISDLRAAVGYSFFRRRDKELGLGFGLHATGFKGSLEGAAAGARSESVTAPLPFLVLYGSFALTDTWALSMRADWLSLSYDKYSGGIRAMALDVVYQPYKNFAFGFGMHSLTLKLDVDDEDAKFSARLALQGPAAFVSYSF